MKSKTQIVTTLGPATNTPEMIGKLFDNGMNIVRLNFSFGSYEEHTEFITTVREVAEQKNATIPILVDLSGPRVRVENQHEYDITSKSVITEKDLKDLEYAIEKSAKYVALSYVGTGDDIRQLKEHIKRLNGQITVIGKIERQKALDNLDDIIEASDAIMIARGDLGNEVPLETIPFIERMILQKCKAAKKPVITATQMMLSMVNNPIPTRAEVTDVAYAVMNGSDGVMLSEEASIGKYPAETVGMMSKICVETENQHPELVHNQI